MKKLFLLLCIFTLLLCGCGKEDKNTTISEASSDDSWSFSDSVDKDKSEYDNLCSSIKNDIQNIENIETVEIEPEDYNKYLNEQQTLTIKIHTKNNITLDDEVQKGINDYVKSTNYFNNYSITYE